MECFEIQKKISAWVDDELPSHERERITSHLNQCPDCRLEASELHNLSALLKNLPPVHASAALSRRILRGFRLNFTQEGISEWWQGLSLLMRGAVCGTALAGLLFGAVLGTSVFVFAPESAANPYQTLYDSKGILP